MELINKYQNGNTTVSIFDDGTKLREFEGVPLPEFPESIDVKITNYCEPIGSNNICAFCHESSGLHGKHGDIDRLLEVLAPLPAGAEVACLHGETVVYNKNGAVNIKDLKIGDNIFDSDNNLKKIIDIKTSKKKTIKIFGKKSFSVICSEDHPFIVNGCVVKAKSLLNKEIDLFDSCKFEKDNLVPEPIDLSKYINIPSNRKNSRGGDFSDSEVR